MSRSYSDPAYGSKKVLSLPATGALNGTVTSGTTKGIFTAMNPMTVTDWNIVTTTAGTMIDTLVTIGKSLAGTGTVVVFGTATMTGTQAAQTVIDATCTATDFATGDDIVIARAAGTETGVGAVTPYIQYRETFVIGDN